MKTNKLIILPASALLIAALLMLFFSAQCSHRKDSQAAGSQEVSHEDHDHGKAEQVKETTHADDHQDEAEGHDGHDHGIEEKSDSLVTLNEKELKEFGIELATAGPGTISKHVHLNGEITVDPRRIAHMSPRFSGIVKEVRKSIGDPVDKGETVAVIESNESLVKYNLNAAINGTVIAMHMSLGENTTDNSHHVTVADLSSVWAMFSVYQKDLFNLKAGQAATVKAGEADMVCEGRVSYISPVVEETTRTASARVVLPNPEGVWKPGMFVTALVLTGTREVPMAVPQSAVLLFKGQNVVVVKEKNGFRPQPVTVGEQNDRMIEIISGLFNGQVYVSKGAFLIKAELQKDSFGHGHGH